MKASVANGSEAGFKVALVTGVMAAASVWALRRLAGEVKAIGEINSTCYAPDFIFIV